MTISEDYVPENYEFNKLEEPRPPIFINELPEPLDFDDDDEEMEKLPPIKSLRNTPSITDFSQFIGNDEKSVTDAEPNVANGSKVVANVNPSVANVEPSVANVEPDVTNVEPDVTNVNQSVANDLQSVANVEPNVANVEPDVANDLQSVANVEPDVANDLQSVTNVEPDVANDLQSVANVNLSVASVEPFVANSLQVVADAETIVANKEENIKDVRKINGEVANAVISCYPSSLQAIKEYYLTTSFVSQRELTAYICKNFIRVFQVDNYIADLNKMTLERNQLKQQLEDGFFDNDKEFVSLQKSVVDYQNQVIELTKERDGLKSSLGQLVERNIAENQVKEATSSDTWQEERKALIAQFTSEFKQGLQECQEESFETSKSLFDYAINHAISLMYEDTRKLHRGTGLFKTSAIRTEADFYTMFKTYIQQYYDHAEKIKATETLQNSNQQ